MAEPIQVTLNLRGNKYEGTITDADGLLFMTALMTAQETELLDKGRLAEAGTLMQSRFNQRRQELVSQGKGDEEVVVEISTTMLHKVERDPEERSRVAARIKERFPTIPNSLVRWDSKSSYAINLHLEELMQLIVGIIGPALEQFETFKAKEIPAIVQEPEIQVEPEITMDEAAAQMVQLEGQMEKLRQKALASAAKKPIRVAR